jgi:hypothetical protein
MFTQLNGAWPVANFGGSQAMTWDRRLARVANVTAGLGLTHDHAPLVAEYMMEGTIGVEWALSQLGGTVTYETTHVHEGSNAMRINRTGTTRIDATANSSWQGAQRYSGEFWLWVDALPSAEIAIYQIPYSSGSNIEIRLGPGGALNTGRQGGASGTAVATTISTGQWYRVSFWVDSSSTGTVEALAAVNDDAPVGQTWSQAAEAPVEWVFGSRLITTVSTYDIFPDEGRAYVGWYLRDEMPAAGTTEFVTLDAVAVGSVSFGRLPTHVVVAAGVATPALVRAPAHAVSVGSVGAPVFVKAPARTIGATGTGAPGIVRQPQHVLGAVASGVASLVPSAVKLQTLAVTVVGAASMVREPRKVVAAASSAAPTFVRLAAHVLPSVTSTAARTIVRSPAKVLSATSSGAPTVSRSAGKVIGAVSAAAVAMVRSPHHVLSAASTSAATILRMPGKVLQRSVAGAVELIPQAIAAAAEHLTGFFGSSLARIGLTTSSADVQEFLDSSATGETDAAPTLGEFDPPIPGGTG